MFLPNTPFGCDNDVMWPEEGTVAIEVVTLTFYCTSSKSEVRFDIFMSFALIFPRNQSRG